MSSLLVAGLGPLFLDDDSPPVDDKSITFAKPSGNEPRAALVPEQAEMWFTANTGQSDNQAINYLSHDRRVAFLESEVWLLVGGEDQLIRLTYPGAANVEPQGHAPTGHVSNYLIGADPAHWQRGLPNYEQVLYPALYPGIDLLFYGSPQGLKYDWLVSAGSDPTLVRERFEGAKGLHFDEAGNLFVTSGSIEMEQAAPECYQTHEITCSYTILDDRTVGYELDTFDTSLPLTIDPLIYSTFVGDTGEDEASRMIVDSSSRVYIVGTTTSANFPTTPQTYDPSSNGNSDVFVLALENQGKDMVFATYIGGSQADKGRALALDSTRDIFITGSTDSDDFPVTNGANQTEHGGESDIFVVRLSGNGRDMEYGTFVGGSGSEDGFGIAVDSSGKAYVVGGTLSSDFPVTPEAYDADYNGDGDIVIFQLDDEGEDLRYSTYMGGNGFEYGYHLALDAGKNAYVVGPSDSADFPTTDGVFSQDNQGGADVFVVKMKQNGELSYSTLVGSSANDEAWSVMVDGDRRAYVVGQTQGNDWPVTENAFQESSGGNADGFLFKLDRDGDALVNSTYVGGSQDDVVYALTMDTFNKLVVAGTTKSADFPVMEGAYDTELDGAQDAFLLRFNQVVTESTYATFLGGSGSETGRGVQLDGNDFAVVSGITESTGFPVTEGVFQSAHGGGKDLFITEIDFNLAPTAYIETLEPAAPTEGDRVTFGGKGEDLDGQVVEYQWVSDQDGQLSTKRSFSSSELSNGTHIITFKVADEVGAWSEEVTHTLMVNARPWVNLVSPLEGDTPLAFNKGAKLKFTATSGDFDGSVVQYQWNSSEDGEIGTEADFFFKLLSVGDHKMTLEVMDDSGAWSEQIKFDLTIKPKKDDGDGGGIDTNVLLIVGGLAGLAAVGGGVYYQFVYLGGKDEEEDAPLPGGEAVSLTPEQQQAMLQQFYQQAFTQLQQQYPGQDPNTLAQHAQQQAQTMLQQQMQKMQQEAAARQQAQQQAAVGAGALSPEQQQALLQQFYQQAYTQLQQQYPGQDPNTLAQHAQQQAQTMLQQHQQQAQQQATAGQQPGAATAGQISPEQQQAMLQQFYQQALVQLQQQYPGQDPNTLAQHAQQQAQTMLQQQMQQAG